MVDPITSQYFPRPPDDSGDDSGQSGNDPTYTDDQVKNVTMGWTSWTDIPSFNLDPGTADPSPDLVEPGATGAGPLMQQPLSVDPINMRSVERDMLAATDTAVEAYTSLKSKVENAISGGSLYGQTSTETTWVDTTVSGGQPQGYNRTDPSPIQQSAIDFATKMDNYQRGALIGLANSLDVVGSYIAAINIAGTTYSYSDRQAKVPEPPTS